MPNPNDTAEWKPGQATTTPATPADPPTAPEPDPLAYLKRVEVWAILFVAYVVFTVASALIGKWLGVTTNGPAPPMPAPLPAAAPPAPAVVVIHPDGVQYRATVVQPE